MNQEKAREFFSAYHEGTLERGLKQTFEQRLKSDAQLQAEYQSFERTMQELDHLKFEEIDVPIYLSDRIATRLEQVRESKRVNPFALLFPRLAFGAIAAIAVVGAGFSIFSHGGKVATATVFGVDPASPSPTVWPSETMTISPRNHGVKLHYSSATARDVQICDDKGTVLKTDALNANQQLDTTLNNPNARATIMEVKVSENGPDDLIVIPGSTKSAAGSQTGSVREFAAALSDRFEVPVVLEEQKGSSVTAGPGKTVTWSLDAGEGPQASARKVLDGTGYQVALSAAGVVTITG